MTVSAVELAEFGSGHSGATYRVSVQYSANPRDLPATFVVKLPAQDPEVHQRVSFGYLAEHTFYTQISAAVDVPMPHCYHCDIVGEGTEFVLLMEDVAPARQGDQVAGCSSEEAMLGVRALAGLHGPLWCDPAYLHIPGSAFPKPDQESAGALADVMKMATDITVKDLNGLDDGDRDTLIQTAAMTKNWLLLEPERFSVLHGDFRLDNLLFGPDPSRITVVDWQTLAVGLPARDLAYFIVTSLPAEVRPTVERKLVAAYHEWLCSYGVDDYGVDRCWQDYRLGVLQAPLIAALGFAFAGTTDRSEDVVRVMLQRSCQAIRDLDTFRLIEATQDH